MNASRHHRRTSSSPPAGSFPDPGRPRRCRRRSNAVPVMTYAQAINDAMHQAMADDPSVICYGLGVGDPKAVFGSRRTQERFGEQRAFDPDCRTRMIGVAVGAARSAAGRGASAVSISFLLAKGPLRTPPPNGTSTYGPAANPVLTTIRRSSAVAGIGRPIRRTAGLVRAYSWLSVVAPTRRKMPAACYVTTTFRNLVTVFRTSLAAQRRRRSARRRCPASRSSRRLNLSAGRRPDHRQPVLPHASPPQAADYL